MVSLFEILHEDADLLVLRKDKEKFNVAKKYKVAMTVHDAIGCVVPEAEIETGKEYVERSLKNPNIVIKDVADTPRGHFRVQKLRGDGSDGDQSSRAGVLGDHAGAIGLDFGDREADVGQMHANLVRATGLQLSAHQAVFLPRLLQFKDGVRCLAFGFD